MNIITQYIIQTGISEEIFILLFSIPIIIVFITIYRRIISFRKLDLYVPLVLIFSIIMIGLKAWICLFVLIFISTIVIRFVLKKIKSLSIVDPLILSALTFLCVLSIVLTISLYLLNLGLLLEFSILTLLTIFFITQYSEKAIITWESNKFKGFFETVLETLLLVIGSYLLISSSLMKWVALNHPIKTLIISIVLIVLLINWRLLKFKELLEFKDVIKHVELPPKK